MEVDSKRYKKEKQVNYGPVGGSTDAKGGAATDLRRSALESMLKIALSGTIACRGMWLRLISMSRTALHGRRGTLSATGGFSRKAQTKLDSSRLPSSTEESEGRGGARRMRSYFHAHKIRTRMWDLCGVTNSAVRPEALPSNTSSSGLRLSILLGTASKCANGLSGAV